jgi:carnitine O-acetyltransferase
VIRLAGNEKGLPIGSLTSDNRDNWAEVSIFQFHPQVSDRPNQPLLKARKVLLAASPSNLASLTAIDSAAILTCLDETSPITREDISRCCWVGDGRNRFYDKHQCKPSLVST